MQRKFTGQTEVMSVFLIPVKKLIEIHELLVQGQFTSQTEGHVLPSQTEGHV